jgi:hypothetical protein
LDRPDDEEIERLAATLADRISKFLQRRGLGLDSDPEDSDPLARDQPWLAGLLRRFRQTLLRKLSSVSA